MKVTETPRNGKKNHIFRYVLMFLMLVIVIVATVILCVDKKHRDDYDNLIQDYYDEQELATDTDSATNVYVYDYYSTNSSGVDSILRVPRLEITMPVCKGNFKRDIELYRISVYDDEMTLGKTTYAVMGHHAIAFNSAMGWLKDIKLGDVIVLEKNNQFRRYIVSDIEVGYAKDMWYLFSVENKDVIYLATCDYSLGRTNRIVYKAVKCTPEM
mgnify:FL=1